MNEPTVDLGELIITMLNFCYSDEQKPSMEALASEYDGSINQVVAAAIAGAISDKYLILHRDSQSISNDDSLPDESNF